MAKRRKPKPFTLPRLNLLGIGIVYMLIYIPQIWAIKVGYTGRSINSRVRGTRRAVFGFTVPVFFVVCPFSYQLEQALHKLLAGLKTDFYKGDGHTEVFFILAAVIVVPVFLSIWWVELVLLKFVLSFD